MSAPYNPQNPYGLPQGGQNAQSHYGVPQPPTSIQGQQIPQTGSSYPVDGQAQLSYLNLQSPYGQPLYGPPISDKKRVVAGALNLLLGVVGAGDLYLGHVKIALTKIVPTTICAVLWSSGFLVFGDAGFLWVLTVMWTLTCVLMIFLAPILLIWILASALMTFSGVWIYRTDSEGHLVL